MTGALCNEPGKKGILTNVGVTGNGVDGRRSSGVVKCLHKELAGYVLRVRY